VSVSQPVIFKPSEYAAGVVAGQKAVQFVITITNGTGKVYDPSLFNTTASSGGAEASSIFSSSQGISGSPDTKVLPGKKVSFKDAYSVVDPKDITLEVTPGFEYNSAIFTN
jgi:hypothetical protein